MMDAMPFAEGEYWATAPAGILGAEFVMHDGRKLKVVKNDQGAVLSPRQVLVWKDRSAFKVGLSLTAADGLKVAGVVPVAYSGGTIATAGTFYVQTRGVAECTNSGASPTVGTFVVCVPGDGKVGAPASAGLYWQAFAIATDATGASAGAVEVLLDVRGA